MKILFISDIHGVYTNLDAIENVINNQNIELLVVLGDLYYSGFNMVSSTVVDNFVVRGFLEKYSDILICMKGNCDSDVDIAKSNFPIMSDISMIYVDNKCIYLSHGDKYSYEKRDKFNNKGILMYGHYHIPSIKKDNNMIYINVGSISLPRDNSPYSYCIYENNKFTLYDIEGNIIDSIIVE